MLDHLKKEAQSGGGPPSHLPAYMAGLLVLGALIVGVTLFSGKKGPERLPGAPPDPDAGAEAEPAAPLVDSSRLPTTDDAATHARYDEEAFEYLLDVVERDLSLRARTVTPAELNALSFSEARGQVFEVRGVIEEIVGEEYRTPSQRIWSVLVLGDDGNRFLVLKHGLDSDPREGRPEDAMSRSTEYLEAGDEVLVRGVYLQRRAGTFGDAMVREPVPVLVATPPSTGFRKVPPREAAINEPAQASWGSIQDQFLGQTLVWEEPALFQVVEWARKAGHPRVVEAIRSGELSAESWDRELFDRWGKEVELTDPEAPRPLTEKLRGQLFSTTGLLADFKREGWVTLPRVASAWDVHELYLLDFVSDYWGNQGLRNWSAFPIEDYTTLKGEKWEHVKLYGFFLKNYTYETKKTRDGAPAHVTMPMFVVVHIEPVVHDKPPFRELIWIIAGVIVLLAIVFYFVLIRGEKKEEARLHAYRRDLRRRVRGKAATGDATVGADPSDAAPDA